MSNSNVGSIILLVCIFAGVIISCIVLFKRDNFKPNISNILKTSKDLTKLKPKIISPNLQNIIIRQPGPLTKITITGSSQGRFLTISVNSDGIISFVEEISLILNNNTNTNINTNNLRKILTASSFYSESGKLYEKINIKQGGNTIYSKNVCYDLSEGPIPKPHIFSFDTILRDSDYTFTDVYGKPGSLSLSEFDRIFNDNIRKTRRKQNNKSLITNRREFFETPFFNFFGKIDRLYKSNGTINENFLGLNNVRVSNYRLLQPSFNIDNFVCLDEYKYNYTKKGGDVVEKVIKFQKFEQKPFKLFIPKEHGYDNTMVSDDIIRMDPVQGIDFNNLRRTFEDIPNLKDLEDAYNPNDLNDKLPRGKKVGDYRYYPMTEPNLSKNEIRGIVRGPSKSAIDFESFMQKKYNLCRAELNSITQPLNQSGNACPDSQDISLSNYVYNPAKNCDWAKIGDAWCNYEEMANDKMIICEWGKLYHGTSEQFVKAIMFVFSGTDDSSDIWSDASFIPQAVPRINALIHYGFYTEFLKWFPKIMKYLKAERLNPNIIEVGDGPSFTVKYKTPYRKIIFGGHSLGGAQAQIAAAYFRNLFEINSVDIEVFTQAAPCPFSFNARPLNYNLVNHSKRLAGYFYDECLPNPTRDDPVVDGLCNVLLGFYCHTTPETPLTEYISRDWSWNLFSGGWFRCEYDGTDYRIWEPPTSILDYAGWVTLGLTSILHKLLSTIEHPIGKYYQKSDPLCKNSNNPNAGDKRELLCNIIKAQYDLNPSIHLESILELHKCDDFYK